MDPRIAFFEKQKYRLRKLLFESANPLPGNLSGLVYQELPVRYVNPSEAPKPRTPLKNGTTIKSQGLPTTVQAKPSQSPAPKSASKQTPINVIYSVKLNKKEYDKIIEKKNQERK